MSAGRVRQGGVYIEIGADPRKFFAAVNRVNQRISRLGGSLRSVGAQISAGAGAIAAPMGLALARFAQFDDAIRAVQAVTGTFGKAGAAAFQSLNDRARELGATTSFTAVEVANLMTELGRAGFKPDEINSMTKAVLDLARASGTDAAMSAGIMSSAIRQFSLSAGDATRVADVLATAANSTFNTVEGLGEALGYAGIAAAQAGLSFEETTAILGVLGNVGLQGSRAGNALRRLVTLAAGEAAKLEGIFNVNFLNDDGSARNIIDIFRDIATATADMPSGERIAKFNEAFGLLGITGAQAIGNAIGDIDALVASLGDANGAASRTAEAMDAGLGGSMRKALSAIEGVALAIGDALAPAAKEIVNSITALAGGITSWIKKNQELIATIGATVAGVLLLGGALVGVGTALQVVAFGFGGILSVVGGVASSIATVVGVMTLAGTSAIAAATSFAAFAASSASSLAVFSAQVAASLASVVVWAAGVSIQVAAVAAATVVNAGIMAAAWAASAARSAASFLLLNTVIGGYVLKVGLAMAAVSVAAATSAAAWVTSALPGVVAFVSASVASLGGYIASCVAAASASLAAAATTMAAWAAAAAPVLGVAVLIAGIGLGIAAVASNAASMGKVISNAFNSVLGGGSEVFGDLLSSAATVFKDLGDIAGTTFTGIYDAIVNGNLGKAADILWAGLYAGWLRGQEAIMGAIDPWISFFQNTFDFLGVEVWAIWAKLWANLEKGANTMGAVVQGTMDNVVNGLAATWDFLEGTIRKSWIRIQGLLAGGKDMSAEIRAVEDEMTARADKRQKDRPGIQGRLEKSAEKNRQIDEQTADGIEEARNDANKRADERNAENDRRADARRQETVAAEQNLTSLTGEEKQTRKDRSLADTLISQLAETTDIDEFNTLIQMIEQLISQGRLTEQQQTQFSSAVNQGADNIAKTQEDESDKAASRDKKLRDGAAAAEGSTLGTFSTAAAALTLGGGTSAAERTATATEETARHTRRMAEKEGTVAA